MTNPVQIPDFEIEKDYTEINSSRKYRFQTLRDITINFKHPLIQRGTKMIFKDVKDKTWMVMEPFHVTISKDYCWDGCSPKWKVMGKWVGTPDFPETALASLVHDAFYQFESTDNFPLSREERDNIFYTILEESRFEWRLWYTMGANFGSTFFSKSKNNNVFSLVVD